MEERSSSSSAVQVRVADATGVITFNRPEALNSFSEELGEELMAAFERLAADDEVRSIVLRGAGKVFCAGGDVPTMEAHLAGGGDRAAYFRDPLAMFNQMVLAIRQAPKPVIAVVHGAVAGVAFNVMLACDLCIAAEKTRFLQAFVKLGLSPDGGGTFFLPRLVGHARACELTMLPTEIDAAQALAWGLVNWVVPAAELDDKVAEVTGQIARGPARAIARIKALVAESLERSLAEQLDAERRAQIANAATDDFAEGIAAFTAKRAPKFRGR